MLRNFLYTFILTGLLTPHCNAQIVPYSQYYNTPLLTNPSQAGLSDYTEVSVHYRRSRVADYEIPSVSFAHPFYRQRDGLRAGGLGANVIRQQAGPGGAFTVTGALATFAYNIHLSRKHHISAGLQGGVVNKRLDLSRITTDHQFNAGAFDPSLSHGENIASNSISRAVVNSGFCWSLTDTSHVQKAMLGIAFFNMNRPSYDFVSNAQTALTYAITGEVLLFTKGRASVHPTFRYMGGAAPFANIGAQLRYALSRENSSIGAGVWYKTTQAMVAAMQYSSASYMLAASMDISSAPNLAANINNAIEVAFAWRFKRK
jgi:type IX secretion system PorP/SprF family membrane protein